MPCTTGDGTSNVALLPPVTKYGLEHGQAGHTAAPTTGTPGMAGIGYSPSFSDFGASSLLDNRRPISTAASPTENISSPSLFSFSPPVDDYTNQMYGGESWYSQSFPVPTTAESYQTPTYDAIAQTSRSDLGTTVDPLTTLPSNLDVGGYKIPVRPKVPEATPLGQWPREVPLKRHHEDAPSPPVPSVNFPSTTGGFPMSTPLAPQPFDYNNAQAFDFPFLGSGSGNNETSFAPSCSAEANATAGTDRPNSSASNKRARPSPSWNEWPFISESSLLGVPTMVVGEALGAAAAAG